VDDAERPIAVVDRVDDDPEAKNVGELFEGDRFALHLVPDRVGPLLPSLDLGATPFDPSLSFRSFSISSTRRSLRADMSARRPLMVS
jgi:hypothetical protein